MKKITKAISALLVMVLFVMAMPIGALSATSNVSTIGNNSSDYEFLGRGFNALSDKSISDGLKDSWISADRADGEIYSEIRQESEAIYAESSRELLFKFGIDISNSKEVSAKIKTVQFGIKSKFDLGIDYSEKSIFEEVYYYYVYRAICEQYRLNRGGNVSTYSAMLSDNFLNAAKNVNISDYSSIAEFFDRYGTHMLVEYRKGGQLTLSAAAVSESNETDLSGKLGKESGASAAVGKKVSASATNSITVGFNDADKNSSVTSKAQWSSIGGITTYFNNIDGKEIKVDDSHLESWVASVSDNKALLPETTEWAAVWEVLPNTIEYQPIKDALFAYYMQQAETANSEFFKAFCSYTNKYKVSGYTYVSPTGYVAQFNSTSADYTVSPLSMIMLKSELTVEASDVVTYEVEGPATIDRNGVVTVNSTAKDDQTVTVKTLINGSLAKSTVFSVLSEGAGLFDGGYGTEARPYLVSTPIQFNNISNFIGKDDSKVFFLQTGTLDFNENEIKMISSFSATYDGNGNQIKNAKWSSAGNAQVGIFANNTGTIKNLTISNCEITSGTTSGTQMIVGLLNGINKGTIENVVIDSSKLTECVIGSQSSDISYTLYGGLITGQNLAGAIVKRCGVTNSYIYNKAQTKYKSVDCYAAGVVGQNNGGSIYDTYARGNYIKAEIRGKVTTNIFGGWTGGARGWAQAGGITARHLGDGEIARCLGYLNDIHTKEATVYSARKKQGSLIAENINGSKVEKCFSQTSDQLVGDGSTEGMQKVEKISASLVNDLDCWIDTPSTEPVIKSVTCLSVSNGVNTYVEGDTINITDLSVWEQLLKQNGASTEARSAFYYQISEYDISQVGEHTVKVTGYGQKTAAFTVNTVAKQAVKMEISAYPQTEFFVGDSFNANRIQAKITYNNGEIEYLDEAQLSFTGFSSNAAGTKTITVSYNGLHAAYDVNVYDISPAYLKVKTLPAKMLYYRGDALDLSGLSLTLVYNNGTSNIITDTNAIQANGFESTSIGEKEVELSYQGVSVKIIIPVVELGVISIEIIQKPDKLTYYVGDDSTKEDTNGLKIRVNFNSGASCELTAGFTVNFPSFETNGKKKVVVMYGDKTVTYDITVEDVKVDSIKVTTLPKVTYYVGDKFNTNGLELELTYNSGDTKKVWSGYSVQLSDYDIDATPTLAYSGQFTAKVYWIDNANYNRLSTEYSILVSSVEIDKIELSQKPTKLTYKVGDTLSTTGIIVNAIYNNKTISQVEPDSYSYDFSSEGTQPVIVWYQGHSTSFNAIVKGPDSIQITNQPNKTEYRIGDTLSLEGMEVTAYYFDGTSKIVTDYSVDTTTLVSAGKQVVFVEYKGRTANFSINVSDEIDEDAPQVVIGNVRGRSGDYVTVEFTLKNTDAVKSMMLYNFIYNDSVLELQADSIGWTVDGALLADWNATTEEATLLFNTNTDINGVIFSLKFKILDGAELGSQTISCSVVAKAKPENEAEKSVDIAIVNGSIEITSIARGDVNGDGIIDSDDVIYLLKYTLLPDYYPVNQSGDMDGNGSVDSDDVIYLLKYTLLPDYYPLH